MIEVRSLAATYYGGHHLSPHTHPWGQLVYAATGVMRIGVADRLWIVPPARAVWVPVRVRHEIRATGDFAMRTLYLAPRVAALLPAECLALEVPPLLRELILHIVRLGMLDGAVRSHRALVRVLLDQLAAAETLPLSLPLPRDRRALALAERLRRDPSDEAGLDEIALSAGASARTIQRLFLRETSLRFAEWRRRLRLLHAIGALDAGDSVTKAGFDAGYASTSAFVAAFRREIGATPARYRAGKTS